MNHSTAFRLCMEECQNHIGLLWNAGGRIGCDTAWAVAEQYEEWEVNKARKALRQIAKGNVPTHWESYHIIQGAEQ